MSLFHLHADIIGRTKGKSAVGSACYQLRANGVDETTGVRLSYSRKQDKPLCFGMMQPDGSPFHAGTKKECVAFWNELSKRENRKDATYARDFDIALQSELTLEQNTECVKKWIEKYWTSRGCAAQYAVHGPHVDKNGKSNNNIHAHVMVTIRTIDENGWANKDRAANSPAFMKDARKGWADIVNAQFQELGIDARIDERTLKEQGKDRPAQKHRGTAATAMQRRGKMPDRTSRPESRPVTLLPSVTEAEVQSALNADAEYRQLEELLEVARGNERRKSQAAAAELQQWEDRISAMTPTQWGEFMKYADEPRMRYVDEAYGEYAQTIKKAEKSACNMWVQQNIDTAEREFKKTYQKEKSALDAYDATRPTPVAERPGVFKTVLYEYRTDSGDVFPGWQFDEYERRQQIIIARWEKLREEPSGRVDVAAAELQAAKDKDYEAVRQAIDAHYPTLSERMWAGAREFIKKLEQFRPVRAMIRAVHNLRARKDDELSEYREIVAQMQKNRSASDDKGMGMK